MHFFQRIKQLLHPADKQSEETVKYLIAGLGNIGSQYENTRHNIGFDILDALAEKAGIEFDDRRYGNVAEYKFKGRTFVLLKPSTYVNLSGRAVNYWMKKEKIIAAGANSLTHSLDRIKELPEEEILDIRSKMKKFINLYILGISLFPLSDFVLLC